MDASRRGALSSPTLLLTSRLSLILLSLSSFFSPAVSLQAPGYRQTLLGWAQLFHHARDPDSVAARNSHIEQIRPLLDLTSSQWRDAILSAVSSASSESDDVVGDAEAAAMTSEKNGTISELCLSHTLAVVTGIQNKDPWALQMVDAMGKPSFGILEGNLIWPGGYNQCLNITANTTVVSHPSFSGRYCNVNPQSPASAAMSMTGVTITWGVCVPDSCSSTDIALLLRMAVNFLNISAEINPYVTCQETRPINAKAVVAIVICSIIGCLMLVGTAVDILFVQRPQWAALQYKVDAIDGDTATDGHVRYGNASGNSEVNLLLPKHNAKASAHPPELGVVGSVLVAFSVYTNGSKLLTTRQAPGSLTCVHGVRFLSMCWVVLGHTWMTPLSVGMNLLPFNENLLTHWTYQGITNATVSVDSFFVLSGLLVTYLTLKEMKKKDGKLNWFLFYFHRFWRLTPAYMLCLMVYVCLAPYWGKGPFWPAKFIDEDWCADNWWTNLLYINNLVKSSESCFGHSWYLANDMQFYILSPLIFVPLFFWPVVGMVVVVVFLLATSITPGVISQHYNLPPGMLQSVQNQSATAVLDYFDVYYFKPYNRMGAYIMGMLAGYFLYRTDCKLRLHWLANLSLWALFTASALAVVYGLCETSNGHPITVPVAALYNAVNRQVWGACVAWVVVACVTGNGGFVNTILSWSGLVPLSRLTYCIYLLHLMVLSLYANNRHTPLFLDDLNLVFLFLGALVAAFAVAFVASLAFEAPMMGLEKIFLRPAAARKEQKH